MIEPFNFKDIPFSLLSQEYEKENFIIQDFKNNSKTCLIFFSSNGLYYPDTIEEFTDKIINNNRYEWTNLTKNNYFHRHASRIIYLRDIFKSFYISGINTKYNTIEKLVSFLKEQTKGYEVITAGSSAGGFAALLYGCLLEASKIFAFSPIFDIAGDEYNIFPIIQQFKKYPEILKYYNLVNLIKNSNSQIFYYYPFYSDIDTKQAKYIENLPNITTIKLNAKIHGEGLEPLNYQYIFFQKPKKLKKVASKIDIIDKHDYFIKSSGFFNILKNKIRRGLKLFLIKCLILSLTITSAFVLIHYLRDPGHIFDTISSDGTITFSVLDGADRYLVPGLLRNCDYDSIIVGNSLCGTTNAAIITEKTNESTLNLSMTGSAFYEQYLCIQSALNNKKLKTIYICLDLGNFYYKKGYIRDGVIFPEYLYKENNTLSKIKYLLDFKTNKFETSGKRTANVRSFNAYFMEQFNIQKQKNNSFRNPGASDNFVIDENYIPELKDNYKENCEEFINFIKTIPTETQIVIYIPPHNMFSFVDIEIRNTLLLKKTLVENLSILPNVTFYDFQIESEITENPDNFFDMMHFSPLIGDYIAENITGNNKYKVNTENIDDFNEILFNQWKDFNYLHSKSLKEKYEK